MNILIRAVQELDEWDVEANYDIVALDDVYSLKFESDEGLHGKECDILRNNHVVCTVSMDRIANTKNIMVYWKYKTVHSFKMQYSVKTPKMEVPTVSVVNGTGRFSDESNRTDVFVESEEHMFQQSTVADFEPEHVKRLAELYKEFVPLCKFALYMSVQAEIDLLYVEVPDERP